MFAFAWAAVGFVELRVVGNASPRPVRSSAALEASAAAIRAMSFALLISSRLSQFGSTMHFAVARNVHLALSAVSAAAFATISAFGTLPYFS